MLLLLVCFVCNEQIVCLTVYVLQYCILWLVYRLNRISAKANISRKTVFISMLVSYWKLKRQSRNGVPLIRRLQASRQGQRVNMYKVRNICVR